MKKLLLSSLLATSIAVATPFVVKDIRIDGVNNATGAAILESLPIKIGQMATADDVSNIVRHLFSQNRFQDVIATKEGNTLVVKVIEHPLISNVTVTGNSAIPKEPLEQNLKANLIAKGEIYDAQKLESFKNALLDHYHSIGRYNAKINTIITTAENGSQDIKLSIDEGEVSFVKSINFEGNKAFSTKELVKQLDIQPDVSWWNIFESSKFEEQVYQADKETLRDYYMDRGYAKYVLTGSEIEFSEDKKEVNLTYKIQEGTQYNINSLRILGNTANLDHQLNVHLSQFRPGQLFRKSDILELESKIKKTLGEYGFSAAKVDFYPKFDDEGQTVQINFIVDAGRRIYVRQIRFEGNNVTADSTLRREMRQQEGAWLSTNKAELGKVRLERTGFYESVDMVMVPVPGVDDQIDLVYKIRERNTGSINFGIGYGTESGISYQMGIKQDNFLGMGSTISLNGTRNDYGTSVSLGYTEPYFTKDGVSLGGNIFYDTYDNSKSSSLSSYKRTTYGANTTLGFPVNENNSYYLGLGFTHDAIKNAAREFSRDIYATSMNYQFDRTSDVYPKMKANDFDFSLGWNFNSLNRGYFPTEGSSASIGGRITIPGSDNKYYKLNAEFRNYLPFDRAHKWVLSTRANVGYANGFSGKALPFYQNYTAGGIGSLRGFAYGAVGPKAIYSQNGQFTQPSSDVVGGNAITAASLEFIVPTPFVSDKYQHNVRTSIFVDAATVWNTKWKKNDPVIKDLGLDDFKDYKKFRASAGIAFQWQSPIGPLAFSYAKPLRKHKGDEIEQFQFSIGGTF